MKYMTGNEIRKAYLDFFESKKHLKLHSFSLVPENDPSLLLIGAGMAPLKPYFTGKLVPPSYRVTTSQKCIRTGDIDNVGRTARHHTFFEMLGNFSFGDYFKKEAITWAWEFLTEVLELDTNKLYVTVYPEDEEAYDIWHNIVGLADERIFKLEDNFWEIGEGPCGPDSEIFYDLGPERGCGKPTCNVGCDCDRYLEIWNLVFTQFNKTKDGSYEPLEKKNIDTGAGLERLASVIQQKESNFETDLLFPIMQRVIDVCHGDYNNKEQKIAVKVIGDHIRAVTMMIGDGILPSNEGRGYVLRRILRRAVRFGRVLGIEEAFLADLVDIVIDMYKEAYPELAERKELIKTVIATEEAQFSATLAQGLELLNAMIEDADGTGVLAGEKVFKLYDTFGFPVELTEEIVQEHGMTIDHDGFDKAMKAQQERARAARAKVSAKVATPDTTGLDQSALVKDENAVNARVVLIGIDGAAVERAEKDTAITIILDKTPFHAEGGGQIGDTGYITGPSGKAEVTDTKSLANGLTYMIAIVTEGSLSRGDEVDITVDKVRNLDIARNHTATHLLQAALRKVLGTHVNQAGSLVTPERLRFDFTHFSPMTNEELAEVEKEVNRQIMKNVDLEIEEMPVDDAIKKGAMALFGEKYGDIVRVVNVPGFSCELCGGSHVPNTSVIGSFRIVGESGTGTGIRRIEAVTGKAAHERAVADAVLLQEAATLLKSKEADIPAKIEQLLTALKEAEREVAQLSHKLATSSLDDILAAKEEIHGVSVTAASVTVDSAEGLRDMADMVLDKVGGIVLLGAVQGDKVSFVCKVDKELTKQGYHAGKIVKAAAVAAGGGGGGRPDMAQAGGKDPQKLEEALKAGKEAVQGAGK
ncbi:alanine--tRNA ligase [Megasphaera micronuciformis F0359]|uniref:Alanine--tRNA ligase n=2 Tax=Megasphaera micronuciformis TaxID=187326 RepID=E2ZDR1_9FIRM|nr:alanine--tRNA ligase [Megasphaera micronuciformis F0359]